MEMAPLCFQNTSKCVHVVFLKGEKTCLLIFKLSNNLIKNFLPIIVNILRLVIKLMLHSYLPLCERKPHIIKEKELLILDAV